MARSGKGRLAPAAVAAIVLLAACGGTDTSAGDPKLAIYVSAPLSGPARAEGKALARGARTALAEAGGEAAGIQVEASYLDVAGRNESRFDAVTAARNARVATEDSTSIAYLGELDSGATRASLPITNAAGLLQVAPGSGARDLVEDVPAGGVPSEVQGSGERTYAQLVPTYELGESPAPRDPEELGHEAMASVLAALARAEDPLDRASVIDAYLDGPERSSRLGAYRISATGEFQPVS